MDADTGARSAAGPGPDPDADPDADPAATSLTERVVRLGRLVLGALALTTAVSGLVLLVLVALQVPQTDRYNDGTRWKLHYVTAREMFNVARAAMDGKPGDPSAYFDYVIPPPPICT